MANLLMDSGAAVRTANVLLRGVGGRTVLLRMPATASADDITEQLGLATPQFQDVELAPVVFRSARATVAEGKAAKWEMLVSGDAVEALVGSLGYGAAESLFGAAFGVLVDGVLMTVESTTAAEVRGSAYLYRLVLRTPLAQAV
ncbi:MULTISPECIES: hypothetical protein [Acidobacteriaceae]|uniref:hypothetical protein n=1 Tax=Acidobacteriaceae TaxID=204434 RepID=UPI00131D4B22|nr:MULTISPECIES: hypothetical protein [Acidobacteriaceae]MDW5265709.1 hypothetical protein [Edaphobacter sp.]